MTEEETEMQSGRVAEGNPPVRVYQDLIVWQKAIDLVTRIYETTKGFPKHEQYVLVSQIRRCAISIPSNIAEGFGRKSSADFVRFLHMAEGSLYELQTQLVIAERLSYVAPLPAAEITEQTREIERLLTSLIRKTSEYR